MNRFACPQSFTSQNDSGNYFSKQPGYPLDYSDSNLSFRDSTSSEDRKIVEYIAYDSLNTLDPNCDFESLVMQIQADFKSNDWTRHFNAITSLRAMQKSCPQEANLMFQVFDQCITAAFGSPKSCIVKHILMFVQEVIGLAKLSCLNVNIPVNLIRALIPRTTSTNKPVREAAEHAMNLLVENCLSDLTIRALCDGSNVPHRAYKDRSFVYLTMALENMREGIANVQPDTLDAIMMTLVSVINTGQTSIHKTTAKNILNYIFNLMGSQNYIRYVGILLERGKIDHTKANLLAEIVNQQNTPRPSIAMELRRMRSSFGPGSRPRFTNTYIEINGFHV